MANQPNNPTPLLPQKPRNPASAAAAVGDYIMAFIRVVFWFVVGAVVCGVGYVALRVVWWGIQVVTAALGV